MPKKGKLMALTCKVCGKRFASYTAKRCCSIECFSLTRRAKMKDTLCWDCEKAVGGSDCPWANKLEPVEGWEAISTTVKMTPGRGVESFVVKKCPMFKRG